MSVMKALTPVIYSMMKVVYSLNYKYCGYCSKSMITFRVLHFNQHRKFK